MGECQSHGMYTKRKFKVMVEEGLEVYANGNAKGLPDTIPASAQFITCLDGIVGQEGMVCKIHRLPWKTQGIKNGDDGLDVPTKGKKRGLPEATLFINEFRCGFGVDEQPCGGY